jgi:2-methylisocitrate lyase-like PEP mutase family enzyme
MSPSMSIEQKGAELRRLHDDPALLQLVNVWDVASARAIADLPQTRALATASHSIAAMYGFEDGENIPRDLMIEAVARVVAATGLPVTADLEAGYGDAGETTRRAIAVGVVGMNLEDQLKPLDESVAAVAAVVGAAEAEGVPFALNARTDAFARGRARSVDENVADAIERGRAFLDVGATCVFVPGRLDAELVGRLVSGIGERKVSVIGYPGSVPPAELERLGVARISYGPWAQNVALTALADAAESLYAGGTLAASTRILN